MKHHTKQKGDLAVVKTIADLTEKEYDILLPISETLPFDLIAYKDNISHRIQVKYARDGLADDKTSWTDKNGSHKKQYAETDFDYYALYLPNLNLIIYPSINFKGCSFSTELPNSSTPFYWYKDFLDFTDSAEKKTYKDFGIKITYEHTDKMEQSHINMRKVPRPSKEELEKLLWEIPTMQLAKRFGVSDKAIEKWAKSYGLSKPPRGYWSQSF